MQAPGPKHSTPAQRSPAHNPPVAGEALRQHNRILRPLLRGRLARPLLMLGGCVLCRQAVLRTLRVMGQGREEGGAA